MRPSRRVMVGVLIRAHALVAWRRWRLAQWLCTYSLHCGIVVTESRGCTRVESVLGRTEYSGPDLLRSWSEIRKRHGQFL